MEATTTLVSLKELDQILTSIQHHHPGILIRYRTLGEVWHPNFLKIIGIQGATIEFHDEVRRISLTLNDLTRIAELEFSAPFQHYQGNCPYEVFDDHDV